MCGRVNRKERRNAGPGEPIEIILPDGTQQVMKFGFTKPNREGKMILHFNARAEGWGNKENKLDYDGPLAIHKNALFADALLHRRCLVPVDSFIEGPEVEKLSKPYLCRMKDCSEFFLGGFWDYDHKTGAPGVCIITTWTNSLIKSVVGHPRSPFITNGNEVAYLHATSLDEILPMLRPFPSELMEAFPINPLVKSARNKELELFQPL